jgi:hypothetical protein
VCRIYIYIHICVCVCVGMEGMKEGGEGPSSVVDVVCGVCFLPRTPFSPHKTRTPNQPNINTPHPQPQPVTNTQVKTAEEAKEATAMGAKLLFLVGNTRTQAVALRPELPGASEEGEAREREEVMVGFDLRRPKEFQYGLNEVEDAWVLRDHRFNAVYVSNLLFQTPLDDVVGPSAVIRALRAKACHFMVDPLDWIEKAVSEGTKETLGELLA